MTPSPRTPILLQSSRTQYVRAENSSEAVSLQGKPAKTPIIAGSVCGGVLLLAWIIGFSIYFRKRYVRKKLKRAAAAIGLPPPPELKSRPETEKVVIPPDPAVLLGQRAPGHAFADTNDTQVPIPKPVVVLSEKPNSQTRTVAIDTGRSIGDVGVGLSGSSSGTDGERVEEHRPLLTITTDLQDISALRRPNNVEKGHGADASSGNR